MLVNIEGFKELSEDEKKELEEMVKKNIEDANAILAKECKDCKLVLGPIKFKRNPDGASTVKKGDSATGKLVGDGKTEVEKEFGKGKGQKIYIVEEILDGENNLDGLGADGQPVTFIPLGTLAVRPIRDKDDNIIGFEGLHGHFILHELLHNAGLSDKDHTNNGSLFDGSLDSGTRAVKRTLTADQCKKLKEYFKARGNTTKAPKSDNSDSKTEKTSLNDYDLNRDDALSDEEFFAMVDDWIGERVANTLFFEGIDLWVSGGGSSPPPISQPVVDPPSGTPLPASLTPVCYLNNLPQSCSFLQLVAADSAVGVGFQQRVSMPSGSTLTVNASTFTDSLMIEGGRAVGQLRTTETLTNGNLHLIAIATPRRSHQHSPCGFRYLHQCPNDGHDQCERQYSTH